MRIFILDTEYLSWSKKQSNIKLKNIRLKNQNAEIINLYSKEIFTNKKKQIENFFKPFKFKNYPYRISKLTGISKTFLDKSGKSFKLSYKKIVSFFPKNSIIITNGGDEKVLNLNIDLYDIKKINKRVYFLNLQDIIYKFIIKNKDHLPFISTNKIKKVMKLNKIKSHNAKNDVKIIQKFLSKNNIQKKNIIHLKNKFVEQIL